MKNQPNLRAKSLVGEVIGANYNLDRPEVPHSPSMTLKYLKRHNRIVAKMRAAGISEEDISFLSDFWQADAVHVLKLSEASDESQRKKASVN